MTEIKDKIGGAVDITPSSDASVAGKLREWAAQIDGTNGVVVDVGTRTASRPTELLNAEPNGDPSVLGEAPVSYGLISVHNFANNPAGFGMVISMERARAKKRVVEHAKAA